MAAESRAVDIARRHRGIIELPELLAVGLDKHAIKRRVDAGWLTRHFEGVYSIGDLDDLGRTDAALRACGPLSMATARSAAAMDDLLPYPAAVSIVIPRGGTRPPGIKVSEPRELPQWTRRHGLRLTTVPETLLSLAATTTYAETLEATEQAFLMNRTNTEHLQALLAARKGARGTLLLGDLVDGPRTRSHLERHFHGLLKDARLPLPETNVIVNGHLVDFWWPAHRLVVETDGWASHGRRRQWERDHARDLDHFGAGVTSLRVTYLQLTRHAYAVIARLGARLLG